MSIEEDAGPELMSSQEDPLHEQRAKIERGRI
jgi:hypothetical protein